MTPYRPEQVLRAYFQAKDENRPHLLDAVFTTDARLEIVNHSSAIAFPAASTGRESIADVLVREFARTYENVYSYYLGRPSHELTSFACAWLVIMSDKATRAWRAGCGRYAWTFASDRLGLASALSITIESMQVFAPEEGAALAQWRIQLPYPWAEARAAIACAPPLAGLAPLLQFLARVDH